jgi:hypothetical protein
MSKMAQPNGSSPAVRSAYQRGWRRMLVDMEIPAWPEGALSAYDPRAMADLYARAGASAVMFACKALTGLCLWPTQVGEVHPGLAGRDVIAETVAALADRDIAGCAYYSVIFDNWAFETHPEWRIEFVGGWRPQKAPSDRHGTCCPNNPGYRDYVANQIADLYGRYPFECAFCDMSFWPGICGCRHCRDRYRAEAGAEFPATVDWTSTEWCAFAAARERWIDEFQGFVTASIRDARPGIAVYHNFAVGPVHWTHAVPFSVTEHSDFLGGDLYGDEVEQLVVMKLMNNLSRSRPVEYMTFVTTDTSEHVQLKRPERIRAQVLAAAAESAAFMFIDAIDPAGTANGGDYDRIRPAFEELRRLEPHLGGTAIEDVAIYFSNESKVRLDERGTPLAEISGRWRGYPHLDAIRGACRALQRAHIPFGVITRRQLTELARYRVLVLPNVTRMDDAEVAAIREYADRGGRVYASKYTSLVHTRGAGGKDFMLADVFGVHLASEDDSPMAYAKPASARAADLIAPQRYLSSSSADASHDSSLLRLADNPEGEMLATLSLPYAHPAIGDMNDHKWASIHSFPPTDDTSRPVIVEHGFGAGRVVYSAFDLERVDADADERLFSGLVRDLLGDQWSVQCETHPRVWLAAFRHSDDAIRVALANLPPAVDTDATLRIRAPRGARFVSLENLGSGDRIDFRQEASGVLICTLKRIPELTMLLARHE